MFKLQGRLMGIARSIVSFGFIIGPPVSARLYNQAFYAPYIFLILQNCAVLFTFVYSNVRGVYEEIARKKEDIESQLLDQSKKKDRRIEDLVLDKEKIESTFSVQ